MLSAIGFQSGLGDGRPGRRRSLARPPPPRLAGAQPAPSVAPAGSAEHPALVPSVPVVAQGYG